MKKILFIGSIDYGKLATAGAMVKNQHLLQFLKQKFSDVKFIDTIKFRKNPFVVINILFQIIVAKDRAIVLSTSSASTYILIKILMFLHVKRKVFYWVIGGDLGIFLKQGKFNPNYFLYFDKILLEGEIMKAELADCGLINTIVVSNFKEIHYFPQKQDKNNIVKFVFLSRVMSEKGVDLILESAKFLNDNGHGDAFLIDIYGKIDDGYKHSFLDKLKTIINVQYCGFLDLRTNYGYDVLAKYDFMLFPTYFLGEGFPGVFIDSFIAGLPIIASDWNLNKEIIEDGVTGLIIKSQSISSLSNAILSVLDGNININKMSINCQEKAKQYKIENVLNDDLLNNLGIF